jgi:hypothetical protein
MGGGLKIDIHPDVIMSEFERHLRSRFVEYYRITNGVAQKFEKHTLENLGNIASQNIFDLKEDDIHFIHSIFLQSRFAIFFQKQVTELIEKEISKKNSGGCLSIILLILIPTTMTIYFLKDQLLS